MGRGTEGTAGLGRDLQGLCKRGGLADRAFLPKLHEEYPSAKFVLTHRSPESWGSFSDTIYKLMTSALMPRRNCTPGLVWQSTWLLRLASPVGST